MSRESKSPAKAQRKPRRPASVQFTFDVAIILASGHGATITVIAASILAMKTAVAEGYPGATIVEFSY